MDRSSLQLLVPLMGVQVIYHSAEVNATAPYHTSVRDIGACKEELNEVWC